MPALQKKVSSISQNTRLYTLFFFSFILIVFSYSNSLQTSWHFDDLPIITENEKIHLTNLSFEQIAKTFSANPSKTDGSLYRPLACFTFALNWYFSQDNVFSYHIVNILIHLLTAYILFSTIRRLFTFCNPGKYSPTFIHTTALLAALLWALAPIQTQAVTYIVQRMASMAAMFAIFSMYAYIRARTEQTRKKYIWFTICLLSYLAALASKSNSALLPISLLLLELSFLKKIKTKKAIIRLLILPVITLITAYWIAYFVYNIRSLHTVLDIYNHRSFTLTERLLTEPRILLMYLSQLAFPKADRLSLEHDITLSTSLLSPWTTIPAILFILTALFLSSYYLKKHPVFTFPVLFYLLNQLIESTVIPLELVFEHRNYLPSLFLFLPVGYLFAQALYGEKNFSPIGRIAIMFCGALYLTTSGHATYTRNLSWATEGSLLNDILKKAPFNARTAYELGRLSARTGDHNKAYYFFQYALKHSEKAPTPKFMKRLALHGLAVNRNEFGQYEQAQQYIDQCLEIDKEDMACQEAKATFYLHQKLYKGALSEAKTLADAHPAYRYLGNAAVAAYYANDMKTFFIYIQKIIRFSLNNHQVMHLTGLGLMKVGSYPNSLFFLQLAHKLSPNTPEYQLILAAAYHLNNDEKKAVRILDVMFDRYPISVIQQAVSNTKQYDVNKTAVNYIVDTFNANIKANLPFTDDQTIQ
jgi:tetratricopeptide (TPR) repeat protein